MTAFDRFIERSKHKHGTLYDYSLVEYKHSHKKVKIKCKKHGIFEQTPVHHISGQGCSKCVFENLPQNQPKTTQQFVKEAQSIHGSTYDYSLVDYKRSEEKIIIGCKIHGNFKQVPDSHLKGAGCKKCAVIRYLNRKNKISKPEKQFGKLLSELGISYKSSFHIENKIYDFYLPFKNLLVEIDGIYWHGKNLELDQLNEIQKHNRENDDIKNRLAQEKGYNLVRIWEDEIDHVSEYIH